MNTAISQGSLDIILIKLLHNLTVQFEIQKLMCVLNILSQTFCVVNRDNCRCHWNFIIFCLLFDFDELFFISISCTVPVELENYYKSITRNSTSGVDVNEGDNFSLVEIKCYEY